MTKNIESVHAQRGFLVTVMNMDGEFEHIREEISLIGIYLNIVSRNEHVPEIKYINRTVKEEYVRLFKPSFQETPKVYVIKIMKAMVFWINIFPLKNGISKVLSPRIIVTGQIVDYKMHCMIKCRAYVQTHKQHNNIISMRSTGVIALQPAGNQQGGYFFFSLTTGHILNFNN